jgi:predicted transport protein
VKIFEAIESYARSLGDVEIVARDRYALFRTKRIFADLVMMKDAVRLAIHLRRNVSDPMFCKTVEDRGKFTHVVKLQQMKTVAALKPLLKEAYAVSLGASQGS